ncbi:hypothetical protein B0H21DRAFT_728722 [Amylocystis lapponica]|nr:hypothetical protein B0H21DRAFT_728722 [Amylocystis lapponica]
MDTDTEKLLSKLLTLGDSLDDLESKLDPLLAQTLPESVVGLEAVQQAKLQVALPYVVYDLVFIYLKTKGIDPKTHPVIQELDRIRQYFDKIKNAEDPAKRALPIDKAAANRFIRHAIAQVKYGRPPGDDEGPAEPSEVRVPVKMTSKMLARAQYQKELDEAGSEEEEDLEIIEDAGSDAAEEEMPPAPSRQDKGKGKAVEMEVDDDIGAGRKRRRPRIDPFAGYGDEPAEDNTNAQNLKRNKSFGSTGSGFLDEPAKTDSGTSTPLPMTDGKSKKERKAAKKTKKKAK